MANSLADQLLKAGVANQQQVRKAKKQKHKQARTGEVDQHSTQSREQAAAATRAKIERDRILNEQHKLEQARRDLEAQIRQLVTSQRQPRDRRADIAYHFTHEGKVKHVYVNAEQQRKLGSGHLVLIPWEGGYELIPNRTAEKILERDPQRCIISNPDRPSAADPDDPYADYQVPDDLMW